MLELCRKKLMGRNLQKMQRVFPQHYDFFPKTFILPVDMQVRGRGVQRVERGRWKSGTRGKQLGGAGGVQGREGAGVFLHLRAGNAWVGCKMLVCVLGRITGRSGQGAGWCWQHERGGSRAARCHTSSLVPRWVVYPVTMASPHTHGCENYCQSDNTALQHHPHHPCIIILVPEAYKDLCI